MWSRPHHMFLMSRFILALSHSSQQERTITALVTSACLGTTQMHSPSLPTKILDPRFVSSERLALRAAKRRSVSWRWLWTCVPIRGPRGAGVAVLKNYVFSVGPEASNINGIRRYLCSLALYHYLHVFIRHIFVNCFPPSHVLMEQFNWGCAWKLVTRPDSTRSQSKSHALL